MKPALLGRDQLINLGRCNKVQTITVVPVIIEVMMMPVRMVVIVVVSVAGQLEDCEPQAGQDGMAEANTGSSRQQGRGCGAHAESAC